MKSAARIVDALPEGRRDDLWAFLKAPNGSPFFRFGVAPPGTASLLPAGRVWRLGMQIPGIHESVDDIAPIAADGRTVVSSVARAFWRIGWTTRGRPDTADGLLLQAYLMGRSSADASTVAGAGELLGDRAAQDGNYGDAVTLLSAAQEAATFLRDGAMLARIQSKLAWVNQRIFA